MRNEKEDSDYIPPSSSSSTSTSTSTSSRNERLTDFWPKGSSLGFYVGIEVAWHVSLFAACYKFRPLVRLTKTSAGKRIVDKVKSWIPTPGSRGHTASKWAGTAVQRIPASGNRTIVATSEWVFLNKVLGIPLWPSKLLLATVLGNEYEKKKEEIIIRRETLRKQQQETEEEENFAITAEQDLQEHQQQHINKVAARQQQSPSGTSSSSKEDRNNNMNNNTHHHHHHHRYSF